MKPAGVLIFLAGVVVGASAARWLFGDAPIEAASPEASAGPPATAAEVAVPSPAAGAGAPSLAGAAATPTAAFDASASDGCDKDPSACIPDTDAIAARAHREWELAMIARAIEADPLKNTGRKVTEVERLEAYEAFAREPVDPAWRAAVEGRVQLGLETLAGIDYEVGLEFIDCRTDRCLARLPIPPGQDYMNAIGGLSGLLPISGILARQTVLGGEQFVDVYLTNISLVEPVSEWGKKPPRRAGSD